MSYNVPEPTPETARYWQDARRGVLSIPYCRDTGRFFFYPRSFSPYTGSRNVEWRAVSGNGRLHSYVINYKPMPGRDVASPVIALVKLDEGPIIMSNVVEVEPDPTVLTLDMPLEVRFTEISDDIALPVFAPAKGSL